LARAFGTAPKGKWGVTTHSKIIELFGKKIPYIVLF